MGASLDDAPFFDATIAKRIMYGLETRRNRSEDVHNQVRVFRQVSEPMRHEDHRPTFSFLPEVGKELVFGFGIECRTGFVYSNELYGRSKEAHERARTRGVNPNQIPS